MRRTRSRRGKGPSASPSPPLTPTARTAAAAANPLGSPLNITRKVLRSSTNHVANSSTPGQPKAPVTATYKNRILRIAGLNEDLLNGFEADSQLRDSMPNDGPGLADEESPSDDDEPDEPESDETEAESASDDLPFQLSSSRGRAGPRRGGGARGGGRGAGAARRGRPPRRTASRRALLPVDDGDDPPEDPPADPPTHPVEAVDGAADAPPAPAPTPDAGTANAPPATTTTTTTNTNTTTVTSISTSIFTSTPALPQSTATSQSTPRLEPRGRRRRALSRQNSGATPLGAVDDGAPPPEPIHEDLRDLDLPPPFLDKFKVPKSVDECEDKADFLVKTRFEPMTNPQLFITALTKHAPAVRSTEVLYAVAMNAQRALKAWQEEYLRLDKRTAPQQHPLRKPATGGRVPIDPEVFEAMKQADLYNYAYDAKKGPHYQDPYAQRLGRDLGRQLRQRRKRDVLDSAPGSEEEGENEGGGPRKRQRRAVQRFEGTATPEFGARGTRKRALTLRDGESASPEPETSRPKRARMSGAAALLPHRIAEMRVESAANSSSEGEKRTPDPPRRRGRPPGSKNFAKRSDAGIKKGPRKPVLAAAAAAVVAASTPTAVAAAPPNHGAGLGIGQQVLFMSSPAPTSTTPIPPPRGLAPLSAVLSETPDANATPAPRSVEPSRVPLPHTPGSAGPLQPKSTSSAAASAAKSAGAQPKTRAKSEKRSQSMTIWWAERKAKAAEAKALLAQQEAAAQQMAAPTIFSQQPQQQQQQPPPPPPPPPPAAQETRPRNPPPVAANPTAHTPTPPPRQSPHSRVMDMSTPSQHVHHQQQQQQQQPPPQHQQQQQQPPPQQPLTLPPLAAAGHHHDAYHMRHAFGGPLQQPPPPPPPTHHQLAPAPMYQQHQQHHSHTLPHPGHHGMHQPDHHGPPPHHGHGHGHSHGHHGPPPLQPLPPPPPPRTQPILAPAPMMMQNPPPPPYYAPPSRLGSLPLPSIAIAPQPPPSGIPSPYAPMYGTFATRLSTWGSGPGRNNDGRM